jgi:GNAT superfamily N-acetyltransferase
MIREMKEEEFLRHFFVLMAELECGRHFKHDDPKHVEWLRRTINLRFLQGARFYAYFLEEQLPIGFISILLDEGPEGIHCFGHKAEILDFGVLPEHRDKGYGTELLQYAERAVHDRGATVLYVATYAKQHRAISFYGKNGLIPVAALPDVHGPDDEGMVYLRKRLE